MIEEIEDIDYTLIAGFLRGLKPDPIIPPSEWADLYRELPDVSAESGRFRTARTPYVIEPLNRLGVHDPAQKIIVKKGSQVGFTELANNWLGYIIDVAPAPMLYVMPTDTMMKDTSKNRIAKMIESTPRLRERIKPSRSRESSNTLLYKEFEGGFVKFVGANSPVGLASTAVRYVYMDEIDRYPMSVDGEGSALGLGETRTSTFGARKKLFYTSTPTLKGSSAIDIEFDKTGQRFYNIPCPRCGEFIILNFQQLRYEVGRYDEVKYECPHCAELIPERMKPSMLSKGQWIPLYPDREDGVVYGYHLSAMYSPYGWYSWGQMVREYEESKGDIPKTIVFANTKLGECYEEAPGDKPDWETIYDRAHNDKNKYEPNKPFASVVFLTAGVDVQADRLEVNIIGWMKGKISQQIDYRVLLGDTDKDEVWKQLTEIINGSWIREDNQEITLRKVAIDSNYNTATVHEFVKRFPISKVVAIQGRHKLDGYFAPPRTVEYTVKGKKLKNAKLFGVGVNTIKKELYGFLKLSIDRETGEVPNGYCHFLAKEPSFFRGLTAEELTQVVNRRGFAEYVWVKKYERNEPLDTFIYARAAAAMCGMDNWSIDRWERELFIGVTPAKVAPKVVVTEQKTIAAPVALRKKPKSSFWKT